MYEYVGHLHIHTSHSDGHGTISEVVTAARHAGIDFVGITDHYHHLPNGPPIEEGGYHGSVLVCVGAELHGAHSHLVAWGIQGAHLPADECSPQRTIDAVNAQGGIGFLAHPFDRGTPLHDNGHCFNWRDWSVRDYTGLSVWNLGSEWKRGAQSVWGAVRQCAALGVADIDPQPEDLARWDALNQERRVVGIGESDNHALPLLLGGRLFVGLRFLPYAVAFRTINTHVLMPEALQGDPAADQHAVYEALRLGRCFIVNRQRGDARGFRCRIRGPGTTGQMGASLPWRPGLGLEIAAPARARFRVIADGREVFALAGRRLRWPVPGPGVYRVEAWRRGPTGHPRLWILGNPIRVTA